MIQVFTDMCQGYSSAGGAVWPMSELKVSTAVALNEIVNAPKEFVSSSPHLVVAQLDWIQTRYLFVRNNSATNASLPSPKEARPVHSIVSVICLNSYNRVAGSGFEQPTTCTPHTI